MMMMMMMMMMTTTTTTTMVMVLETSAYYVTTLQRPSSELAHLPLPDTLNIATLIPTEGGRSINNYLRERLRAYMTSKRIQVVRLLGPIQSETTGFRRQIGVIMLR